MRPWPEAIHIEEASSKFLVRGIINIDPQISIDYLDYDGNSAANNSDIS